MAPPQSQQYRTDRTVVRLSRGPAPAPAASPFACEGHKLHTASKEYCLVTERRSFDQAASECERMHGRLATLADPEESKKITAQLVSPWGYGSALWLGCSDEEAEGKWKFTVTAVDDQGASSTVEQPFAVNDTLGSLKAPATVTISKGQKALTASFTLARAAQVTATIRTAAGIVVSTVRAGKLGTGPQSIAWDGRTDGGKLAFDGRYTLVVSAVNELGRSDLSQVFTARRG